MNRLSIAILLITFGMLTASAASAQEAAVSPAPGTVPIVSLYTMGPGDDTFSRFGHAAACVFDQTYPNGVCYNYGTADFNDPLPLIWGVLRGRATFWVSEVSLARVMKTYKRLDRTLYRQDLPLTDEAARALAARLALDATPENRNFIYHHFNDNCATRLRDHIDVATGGKLRAATDQDEGDTLRQYVREGFAPSALLSVSSELLMSRVIDTPRTRWQAMFMPEVMREEIQEHLGVAPQIISARKGPVSDAPADRGARFLITAGLVLGALLVPLSLLRSSPRPRRAARAIGAGVIGAVGALMFTLALISTEQELWLNEYLFLFLPLDLALPRLKGAWLRRYCAARVALVTVVALLGLSGVFLQPSLGPLLIVLAGLSPSLLDAFASRSAATPAGDAVDPSV